MIGFLSDIPKLTYLGFNLTKPNHMKKLTSLLLGLMFLLALTLTTACGDDDEEEERLCSNTCAFASDGDCDDGGSGSEFNICDLGTDCNDCGAR